jgi:hypothetical protein
MTKQTQLILVLAVIVSLVVGWLGGRWYTGYKIESQIDNVTEEFNNYIDDLTGGDGEFDQDDILNMYDIDDLSDKLINDMPSSDAGCSANGNQYNLGDGYFDGCNWCGCNNGSWVCTERACEAVDVAE